MPTLRRRSVAVVLFVLTVLALTATAALPQSVDDPDPRGCPTLCDDLSVVVIDDGGFLSLIAVVELGLDSVLL